MTLVTMTVFEARLRLAKNLATQRHVFDKRQVYAGLLPYTHHLEAVEREVTSLVCTYYLDTISQQQLEELRLAAWLHDLVEDTDTKLKEIEESFGPLVARLVAAVTNPKGGNRRERHADTYPRIRAEPLAVLLKLADRLANIRAGGALVQMYRKEHEDFVRALYTQDQWDDAWAELEQALEIRAEDV